MMPRKNFFANAALVLASTFVSVTLLLAAGEMTLRWRYGALPTEWRVPMKTYDERRGWALQPGHYSYFDTKAARRVDVSINELGLRNRPLSRESEPGVERIMLLGDSFVFGAPLDEDHTISARLQARAGESFEIVNVGVPGYGTGQEYRLVEELQARGYRLGRKLVLAFFTNDIQDNLGLDYSTMGRNHVQPAFDVDAAGNLQQTLSEPPRAPTGQGAGEWLGTLLFFQFLRYQLEVVLVSHPSMLRTVEAVGMAPALPRTPGIVAGWYGAQWEAHWAVTAAVLEYLVKALRAMPEAPELYIAFVPSPFQVHESFKLTVVAGASSDARYASFLSDPDRPQRVLQLLARRLDVHFIDLTPALRQAAAHSVVYFPREGHFNELGCDIAAQVIFEQAIKERGRGSRASHD